MNPVQQITLVPIYQKDNSMMGMLGGQPVLFSLTQPMQQNAPFAPPQIMMAPPLHPAARVAVDANIAATFGPLLFNPFDPYYLQHKNTPRKLENSNHKCPLIMTIYLIAGISAGAACLILEVITISPIVIPAVIMAQAYLLYIIITFCCNDTRKYLLHTKPFELYEETYKGVVRAAPYFRFNILCYHFENRRDEKGNEQRVRVNTHTAQEQYHPRSWTDESGNLGNIIDTQEYIFLKYNSRFYFGSSEGQANYNKAWNEFLKRNIRDTNHDESSTFQIPGFQEEIGFRAQGKSSQTNAFYFLLTFLGLGYPYNMWLERSVARYELNIVKNITS